VTTALTAPVTKPATALSRILIAPAFAAALGLAAVIVPALPAAAQMQPQVPTLTANGTGTVYVVPDIAIVSIGVTSRGANAAEALASNSAGLTAAIDTIRAQGVAERDIGTSGFSIYPVYEDPKPDNGTQTEPPKIVGYQVTNEVRVTIRDIEASGAILDKVVSAGANQVNGITFDSADRTTPADAALADAVADARRQAEIMATAAGVRLVRIVSINASSGGVMPMARFEMSMASAPVPVLPGQREVNANATVTWEIAPQ
jgi:uncharacterized protein YggE